MLRQIQILIAVSILVGSTGCGTMRCIVRRLDNMGKRCFCLQDSLCCDNGCQSGGSSMAQIVESPPIIGQPLPPQTVYAQPLPQPFPQQSMPGYPVPAQSTYMPGGNPMHSVLTEPVNQFSAPDPRLNEELHELKKEHDSTKSELDEARGAINTYEKELSAAKNQIQTTHVEISDLRNQQLEDKLERNRIDAKYRELFNEQEIAIQQFESRLHQMLQQTGAAQNQPLNADSTNGGESYRPQRYR